MKTTLFFFAVLLLSSNSLFAQQEWKERSEFQEILDELLDQASKKEFRISNEQYQKLKEKNSALFKDIFARFPDQKNEMRRHAIVLSERVTLIGMIIENPKYTQQELYGELVRMYNRFQQVLLKGEKNQVAKSTLKFYKNEEKKYLKYKKENNIR